MGGKEVGDFLTYLAVNRKVSASTQNQALNAIVFLYKQVLHRELQTFQNIQWAKRPAKLPVVLTREEVKRIFEKLNGKPKLMVALLYGAGLRLRECLRLRIKDVDFGYHQIIIRDGKGQKDRVTVLPALALNVVTIFMNRPFPDLSV